VASQVAVAVDNALNVESSQAYQNKIGGPSGPARVLLDLNNVLVTSRELPELFRGIVSTAAAGEFGTTIRACAVWIR